MKAGLGTSARPASLLYFLLLFVGAPALFLAFAGPTVFGYFTPDDAMNLDMNFKLTIPELVWNSLTPWSTVYRPSGGLAYRLMYGITGFNPLPWRALFLSLVLANSFLLWQVARDTSGSREVAAIAAFVSAYHARFFELYWNNGAIFDVLCGLFVLGALVAYRRVRSWATLTVCLLLTLVAMQSKEIGLTLPALFLFYELLLPMRLPEISRKLRWVAIVASGSFTVLAALAKMSSASIFKGHPLYTPSFSLERILGSAAKYLGGVLFQKGPMTWEGTVAFYLGLLAVAAVLRSRVAIFGVLFCIAAQGPIDVVVARTPNQMFVPWMGLVLCFAALLARMRQWIARRWTISKPQLAAALRIAVVALGVIAWTRLNIGELRRANQVNVLQNEDVRQLVVKVHASAPNLRKGASILLVDDPFPKEEWAPLFVLRLAYGDPTLDMPRVPPPAAEWGQFDLITDYCDGSYTVVRYRAPGPSTGRSSSQQ
jgi:hypothetical protein